VGSYIHFQITAKGTQEMIKRRKYQRPGLKL